MRLRIPLYGKVLFWFFVNLALVLALAYIFVRAQLRLGMEWLIAGPGGQRLEATSEVITADLRERPVDRWSEVLERYAAVHHVVLAIFRNDGRQIAGPELTPPAPVMEKLRDRRGPPNPRQDRPRPRGEGGERRPPDAPKPPPAKAAFFLRVGSPARYWVGVHIGVTHDDPVDPRPVTLLVVTDSLTGGGLLFEPTPWITLVAAALAVSALVWLPIVGGITRSIRRINSAARRIAEGCFDVRVSDPRRDELGELGESVNAMAGQLGEYVARQRRLTADIAHELCSPIARMQRALGVVEQRGTPEQTSYLQKLDLELQHMARLVEEVLSFSKATTMPKRTDPEEFDLAELVADVVAREAADAEVVAEISAGLRLHTIREALGRAIANVVRNAVRYAAQDGPIVIHAQPVADAVEIRIRDRGPGVAADSLEKIFEPFYRPEVARQRSTGGSGLGLAIARRCVEACGGKIAAQLAPSAGLVVSILLPRRS